MVSTRVILDHCYFGTASSLTRCQPLRFVYFRPDDREEPPNEIRSLAPVEHSVGFEPATI